MMCKARHYIGGPADTSGALQLLLLLGRDVQLTAADYALDYFIIL